MFWFKKNKFKKALKANGLIHDIIITAVFDKYFKKEALENNDFGLQLLARSLNWAVPRSDYDFENDLAKVEDAEIKKQLKKDENQIFLKGMSIINSDLVLEKLITFYVAYEINLINILFTKDDRRKYPGITRMKKFLCQTLEKHPDVKSSDFKEDYKNLLIEFNNEYGKTIKKKTIDSLFRFL